MLSTSKNHISLNLRCADFYNAPLFYVQLWTVILKLIPILRNEEKNLRINKIWKSQSNVSWKKANNTQIWKYYLLPLESSINNVFCIPHNCVNSSLQDEIIQYILYCNWHLSFNNILGTLCRNSYLILKNN